MAYKLASLFDGSGGFPLAASLSGITPVWAAEVEPYPVAVTRSRFPNMLHLGDVSKINGKKVQDYTREQMLTWYKKLHTDSAEYKMWGNGIALPPALYVMQGIVDALRRAEEDAWLC